MISYLLIRSQPYVPGDVARTAANLLAHEGLAGLGTVADVAEVITQAATAVAFWQLFRPVQPIAAGLIAAFGLVNAVLILVSTACTSTPLRVALRAGAASAADAQLLYDLSAAVISLAGLFFGLGLIPMGRLAVRSGYMPRPLGRLLVAGGVGYLRSVLAGALLPDRASVASALTMPATAAELLMVGYLLVKGVAEPAGRSRGARPAQVECEGSGPGPAGRDRESLVAPSVAFNAQALDEGQHAAARDWTVRGPQPSTGAPAGLSGAPETQGR